MEGRGAAKYSLTHKAAPQQNASSAKIGKLRCTDPCTGVVVWEAGVGMGPRGPSAAKEHGVWMMEVPGLQWQRRGSWLGGVGGGGEGGGLERPEEKVNCNLQATFQP